MRTTRATRLALKAGVLTSSVALAATLVAPAAGAATAARDSSDWLVSQLDDGLAESEYQDEGGNWQSYTDFGLTLDFFYAFEQLDIRAGQRRAILGAIEPRADEYTDAYGTTYAGALGKLLTAVQTQGLDPSDYADGDLLPRLEERVVTSGPEQGRAKDALPDPPNPWDVDTSNTFGQSFVATALTTADSSRASDAIAFLLMQQCSDGFFRESMDSPDFTCDSGDAQSSRPDVDATATVSIALRQLLPEVPADVRDDVRVAARDATRWLVDRQARNGSFVGARNTNSAGLASLALSEAGRNGPARKAAVWVNKLRVTKKVVRNSALKRRDVGAIAYDKAAFKAGKRDGLARDARYEWRRAAAQAAPALDAL